MAMDPVHVAAQAFFETLNAMPPARASLAEPTSNFRIDVDLSVEGAARLAADEIAKALLMNRVGGTCRPPIPAGFGAYHFTSYTGWHFACERGRYMDGTPRPEGSPIVTFSVWWNPSDNYAAIKGLAV